MIPPDVPSPSAHLVRRAVRDFEGMLIGYAANLTGDIEMARDVVQDTLIRLHAQDPAKLDGPGLKAWLFTVCRNRALDLLRRNRRLVSLEDSPMDHLPDAAPLPDARAADADETALVLNFMRRLAPNQAEVLRLKFQNDLSYQEIADITGLSATNVGFLIHTGLKKLRILLAPEAAACA
ncbi:MAG: sigma-70 family RNA polymerase sigma factor [Verrucomicrobiota bacterium]